MCFKDDWHLFQRNPPDDCHLTVDMGTPIYVEAKEQENDELAVNGLLYQLRKPFLQRRVMAVAPWNYQSIIYVDHLERS